MRKYWNGTASYEPLVKLMILRKQVKIKSDELVKIKKRTTNEYKNINKD